MAVIGFAMSFFVWRRYPLEIIVGGTVVLVVVLQIGVFFFLAWQQGITPLVYLQRTVTEVWTLFSQLIEKEPILQQEFKISGVNLAELTTIIAQLIPAILLINNTLVVLMNYLLSRHLRWPQGCGTADCLWHPGKLPVGWYSF